MIFIWLFDDIFCDNLFFSFYWLKIIEREKEREMIRTSYKHEKKSCSKVISKYLYKYYYSIKNYFGISVLTCSMFYLSMYLTEFCLILQMIYM